MVVTEPGKLGGTVTDGHLLGVFLGLGVGGDHGGTWSGVAPIGTSSEGCLPLYHKPPFTIFPEEYTQRHMVNRSSHEDIPSEHLHTLASIPS